MSKTIKGRLKHLDKYISQKWKEHYWHFICKYSHKVDWKNISQNPNITMEVIENHTDKPWNLPRRIQIFENFQILFDLSILIYSTYSTHSFIFVSIYPLSFNATLTSSLSVSVVFIPRFSIITLIILPISSLSEICIFTLSE